MSFPRCILYSLAALALPAPGYAGCDARSGPGTAALVELYTSEGCSSCPPADEQLRRLRRTLAPGASFVPLSLHVGYWDYIGWKDPYAQPRFAERQRWITQAGGRNLVYTPQFFVNGAELRSWSSALRETVRAANAKPPAADIHLRAERRSSTLVLDVEASSRPGAEPAALFLALAESGLTSQVSRGENEGRALAHDHVVRAWRGPVRLEGAAARVRWEVDVQPAWNASRLELAAFVQGERSGTVLQALSASACAVPDGAGVSSR